MVTGSKFFEGPPFSGAVVLPALMSEEIEEHLRLSREESLPGVVSNLSMLVCIEVA